MGAGDGSGNRRKQPELEVVDGEFVVVSIVIKYAYCKIYHLDHDPVSVHVSITHFNTHDAVQPTSRTLYFVKMKWHS